MKMNVFVLLVTLGPILDDGTAEEIGKVVIISERDNNYFVPKNKSVFS